MIRTIARSPIALVNRLTATKGKSDQRMLIAQNERYNKIRTFFRSSGPTQPLLATSTARAANNRNVNTYRSIGFPSTYAWVASTPAVFGGIPSHQETERELIWNSHIAGIQ